MAIGYVDSSYTLMASSCRGPKDFVEKVTDLFLTPANLWRGQIVKINPNFNLGNLEDNYPNLKRNITIISLLFNATISSLINLSAKVLGYPGSLYEIILKRTFMNPIIYNTTSFLEGALKGWIIGSYALQIGEIVFYLPLPLSCKVFLSSALGLASIVINFSIFSRSSVASLNISRIRNENNYENNLKIVRSGALFSAAISISLINPYINVIWMVCSAAYFAGSYLSKFSESKKQAIFLANQALTIDFLSKGVAAYPGEKMFYTANIVRHGAKLAKSREFILAVFKILYTPANPHAPLAQGLSIDELNILGYYKTSLMNFIDEDLKNSAELIDQLMSYEQMRFQATGDSDFRVFQHAGAALRNDYDFVVSLIKKYPEQLRCIIEYAGVHIKNDSRFLIDCYQVLDQLNKKNIDSTGRQIEITSLEKQMDEEGVMRNEFAFALSPVEREYLDFKKLLEDTFSKEAIMNCKRVVIDEVSRERLIPDLANIVGEYAYGY